ncbi:ferritin family protein [Sporomusa sp.]|jgi:rubrerythrin|uniref:ferritin-like domain-containing protein n=1 Tax=Sporomusa sp. TaxID=2078658 RepID=UPI002CFC8A09|nr:ferritin family protein [Sporomusa sp.]HWR07291.1 ferritin family protein [Sporomusa sp.]
MTHEEYAAILKMAIANEVESYEFYKGVSEKATDIIIQKMFSQLAAEECGHQKLIEGFLAGDFSTMRFHESADYKISETVDKPKLSVNMKPADAIALAMKNEEEAMNMYAEFANASVDQEQKKIFQDLSVMEKSHKIKLEEYYVNIAYAEVW